MPKFIVVVVLSALLGCACTQEKAVESSEQRTLVQDARSVLDDVVAERWSDVTSRFDETMTNALSETELAAAWESFQGMKGDFESAGTSEVVERPPNTVVNIELTMSSSDGQFRVTFDREARIAGLFFLNPGVPVP